MSESTPEKPDTTILYEVQYRTDASKPGEWFVMDGRDHNEKYRKPGGSLGSETTSMDEAVDTAEALATRRAYPHDPTTRFYRRVTASRVIVRVYTGHVAAVYEAR